VPLSDVVGVVAHRLGLAAPPISTEVDAPDTATVADVESSALASLAAAAAFDQLTPRDRLLLLVLDDSVREAAAFVGVSKTTAADGLARLRTKLAALLVDVDAQGDVLQQLIVLSARWADERTDNDRTAS
jgi:DNA-directed RNA polymerase specialized sigma24 family protein